MKIQLIKLNAVCLRLPSEYIKEVAHLNKRGSLQKKPQGVF